MPETTDKEGVRPSETDEVLAYIRAHFYLDRETNRVVRNDERRIKARRGHTAQVYIGEINGRQITWSLWTLRRFLLNNGKGA